MTVVLPILFLAPQVIILPSSMSGSEKREKMAVMEAAISSSLSHPNIVQVRPCATHSSARNDLTLRVGAVCSPGCRYARRLAHMSTLTHSLMPTFFPNLLPQTFSFSIEPVHGKATAGGLALQGKAGWALPHVHLCTCCNYC